MIASVAFKNFKALRRASLALQPFNLVIGPNGSGKTSLIQAVLQLRSLARLPLAAADTTKKLHGPEIDFHFSPPHERVEARMRCAADVSCDLLHVTSPTPAEWEAVKEKISHARSYVLEHTTMLAPVRRADGGRLAAHGSNLAAVLAERQAAAPEAFARFTAEVLRLLPEFAGVQTRAVGDEHVELALTLQGEEGVVTAENLSQGTLYLLAVLAIVHDPAPPAIVCCEEIDRGIHPRMLREMRDALYRLSYPAAFGEKREATQVITTTHSPYLLDLFREHPEEVVISQKHGTKAWFERLADRKDLPELLREGSLGDIWFSGILGGVPEQE